jgi:hypothetical protein
VKTCSECRRELSDSCFNKRTYRSGNTGLQHNCKECATVIRKRYWKPHSSIRLKLGLTVEEVEQIIKPQKCASCGVTADKARMCIDHCHETKKVRGLLCHSCNTALGLLKDNVQNILRLSQYLAQSKPLGM